MGGKKWVRQNRVGHHSGGSDRAADGDRNRISVAVRALYADFIAGHFFFLKKSHCFHQTHPVGDPERFRKSKS